MSWAARATLMHSTSSPWPRGLGNLLNVHRDRDRLLQLLILNEEFLVNAGHQLALITSLPFVHTARRSYRLGVLVKCSDWLWLGRPGLCWKVHWTLPPRGRRSRNKVSVGEPAEGSLNLFKFTMDHVCRLSLQSPDIFFACQAQRERYIYMPVNQPRWPRSCVCTGMHCNSHVPRQCGPYVVTHRVCEF